MEINLRRLKANNNVQVISMAKFSITVQPRFINENGPACKFDAVDLGIKEQTMELTVGAIIWATGWKPYDAAKIQPYGYDHYAKVITSVELDRMTDPLGPTGGKLVRSSDGKEAKNVAFNQCAGSRDKTIWPIVRVFAVWPVSSSPLNMREQFGDEGKACIYYIDIRAIGRINYALRAIHVINRVAGTE